MNGNKSSGSRLFCFILSCSTSYWLIGDRHDARHIVLLSNRAWWPGRLRVGDLKLERDPKLESDPKSVILACFATILLLCLPKFTLSLLSCSKTNWNFVIFLIMLLSKIDFQLSLLRRKWATVSGRLIQFCFAVGLKQPGHRD